MVDIKLSEKNAIPGKWVNILAFPSPGTGLLVEEDCVRNPFVTTPLLIIISLG